MNYSGYLTDKDGNKYYPQPKSILKEYVDLNEIKEVGFYWCNEAPNRPENINGSLLVQGLDNNYLSQQYITPNGDMYMRVLTPSGWSSWNPLTTISGTWTPTITTVEGVEPTVEYTSRRGFYRKIGNMVYVDFYIRGKITALNGTYNYSMIKGLPYPSTKNVGFGQRCITLAVLYSLIQSPTDITLVLYDDYIRIQGGYGSYATTLQVTPTSYFEIGGSGWYTID